MVNVEEITKLAKQSIKNKDDSEAAKALLQLAVEDITDIDLDWEFYVRGGMFQTAVASIRLQNKDSAGAGLDADGNTALHVVIVTKGAAAAAAVKGLTEAGVPASNPNKAMDTPLHIAARLGYLEVCKALVEGGADPLKRNGKNRMPRGEIKATREVKEFLLGAEEAAEKAREEKRAALWGDKMKSVQTDNACGVRVV